MIKFKYLNINTILFNIYYFPFTTAIKLPVLVSSKVWLKQLGGKVIIKSTIKPGMIKIGYGDIAIFDKNKSRSIWSVSGNIIFNGTCFLGHGSKISVEKTGTVIFGDNFTITAESTLIAKRAIIFGDNCLLSWNILIMDSDFHNIKSFNDEIINKEKQIKIGHNVWIGTRAIILKGVCIPNNSVIAAGSVVSKSLAIENAIYGGNPIKLIKQGIKWEKECK